MRVTLPLMYGVATRDILRKQENINRLSRNLSSGLRLHNPHDDPEAWGRSLNVQDTLHRMQRYESNLDFATNMLSMADSGLNHVHDLLIRAKEIGMAANTPNSQEEKKAYVEELDQLVKELALTTSERYNGQNVFAGKPIWNEGTQRWEWEPGRPSGDDLQVPLEDGLPPMTVPCDLSGILPDLMNVLEDLKTHIENEDSSNITTALASLDTSMEQIRGLSSTVGARLKSLERRKETLNTLTAHRQEHLSELRDTDFLEAISSLQANQIALEAALKSSLALKDLSLVRYL
ncbi:MAG: flagellin [Desulfosoma sp.]